MGFLGRVGRWVGCSGGPSAWADWSREDGGTGGGGLGQRLTNTNPNTIVITIKKERDGGALDNV